ETAARAFAVQQERDLVQDDGSLIGQTISHYRILERLGSGGMGVVWKAYDTRLNRFVALKFLPACASENPELQQRFFQEARAASALNHPNIITVYDIGQAPLDGKATDFIVMEFVPGKTLDEAIPRKGMPVGKALRYAVQLAEALTAAHA